MYGVTMKEVIIYLGNHLNLLITHSLDTKVAQFFHRTYLFSIA
jgi:hypothetical protein